MKTNMKINKDLKVGIGIDVGHSRVKFGFVYGDKPKNHFMSSFPTVVIDYFVHNSDETRVKIEREDMVELDGKKYFFGETAQTQGSSTTYTGQEQDWIQSVEHDILILGAWTCIHEVIKKERKELPSGYVVVLGLPTKFYSSQKDILIERAERILRTKMQADQDLKIVVKPQSEAPLACLSFNEIGVPTSELKKEEGGHQMDKESWGVIEGGFKTTDYSLWYNGQIINRLSDSSHGAFIAYESVDKELSGKIPTNLNGVLEKIIETKHLFHKGEMLDFTDVVERGAEKLQKSVLEKAKQIFDEHKDLLYGIIVAGGSTSLIYEALKDKYRAFVIPNIDPRYVVLEAFLRISLYAINVRKVI